MNPLHRQQNLRMMAAAAAQDYQRKHNLPKSGLVLYHPLTEMLAKLPTGQNVTLTGSNYEATTYKGLSCIRFTNATYLTFPAPSKASGAGWDGTISFWAAHTGAFPTWFGSRLFRISTAAFTSNGAGFQLLQRNGGASDIGAYAGIFAQNNNSYNRVILSSDVAWKHICIVGSIEGKYSGAAFAADTYVNGEYSQDNSLTGTNSAFSQVGIGCQGNRDTNSWYFCGLRIYNRHLSTKEIATLYHEFTPTE